jgi:carboxypeptidase family protein
MGRQRAARPFIVPCLAVVLGVAALTACRQGVPVIDPSERPPTPNGTISGIVRGPEGTSAIEGRSVEVVNVVTGERQSATTNTAGGFTFKVAPGKYRVDIALRDGESLSKRPGVISVNKSDVDAHADFVLAVARIAHPRYPAYRDASLGPPIA